MTSHFLGPMSANVNNDQGEDKQSKRQQSHHFIQSGRDCVQVAKANNCKIQQIEIESENKPEIDFGSRPRLK